MELIEAPQKGGINSEVQDKSLSPNLQHALLCEHKSSKQEALAIVRSSQFGVVK